MPPFQGFPWLEGRLFPGLTPWADLFHRFAVALVPVGIVSTPYLEVIEGRPGPALKGPDRRARGVSPGGGEEEGGEP